MVRPDTVSQRMVREGFAGMTAAQQIDFATQVILEVRDTALAGHVTNAEHKIGQHGHMLMRAGFEQECE